MKKIKILEINKFYYPVIGGIEKIAQDIAEGLKDRVDIKVLVCQKRGRTSTEKINGVNIYRAGSIGTAMSMPLSISFMYMMRKMLRNADVLQCHMPFPLGDIGYLVSGFKGKVVVWWHSDIIRQKKMMFFYKPIMEAFLKRADIIVVATQGHIDSSKYLGKYKEKCRIIPYGINYNEMMQGISEKHLLVTKSDSIKLLFIGRLVYYKGVSVLIDAMKKVKNVDLFLIGSGPLKGELLQQVHDLNLDGNVHFLGDLKDDELKACLRDCDIFVLPSIANSEAFGIVQIEAMAFGKPVINTNLPTGVPYVSLDGISGITVEPDEPNALAEAIQFLADHKEIREKYGKEGIKRVIEFFNRDIMLDQLYDIYSSDR